jgi:transcription elongation factor GreA
MLVANENITSMSEAARFFANSLATDKHLEGQEALRFARWYGDDRTPADIRPADIEAYVESFGAHSPNATARADALKNFLAFAHKQKILPERYVSHVRVRRTQTRSLRTTNAVAAPVQTVTLTTAGKDQLEAELAELTGQRPRIAAELRAARADGDVRENAPLDAAREAQGQLEARIREIENILRIAVVDDVAAEYESGAAHVGSKIVLANVATGTRLEYQLVNAAEARAGTGKLSVDSPVGAAIVGHRAGDEVEVAAPSGLVRFRIESIES